jgi:hypothetical protein
MIANLNRMPLKPPLDVCIDPAVAKESLAMLVRANARKTYMPPTRKTAHIVRNKKGKEPNCTSRDAPSCIKEDMFIRICIIPEWVKAEVTMR